MPFVRREALEPTFDEAVGAIAAASGQRVCDRDVAPDEYIAFLQSAGWPAEIAASLTALFGMVLDGRNAYLSDGVPRALGRNARDFSDFVREASAAGIWELFEKCRYLQSARADSIT